MKKGFTMIELIFVIVILGILAAVAIPKLAATRNDAKVAAAVQDVTTAINDIGAYYTAQGSFGTNKEMTNVDMNGTDNNVTTGFDYMIDSQACVNFKSADVNASKDGKITVSFPSATGSAVCGLVQDNLGAKDINKTYSFGGRKVKF